MSQTAWRLRAAAAIAFLFLPSAVPAEGPQWIWHPGGSPAPQCCLRKSFDASQADRAFVEIAADNSYELFLNGRFVGRGAEWQVLTRYDVSQLLVAGKNQIAVRATNNDGPAGLAVRVSLEAANGSKLTTGTDRTWRSTREATAGWQRADFNDAGWTNAAELGELGKAVPWGAVRTAKETTVVQGAKARPNRNGSELVDGDRIVLLGSAFFERDGRYGYLETEIVRRLPKLNLTIRNLGWSGDTVATQARSYFGPAEEGFTRLRDTLRTFEPTVVVAMYGANESYAGEAGMENFLAGYKRLLSMIADETGALVILASPPPLEDRGPPLPSVEAQNRNIHLYQAAIRQLATEKALPFCDLTGLIDSAAIYSRQSPITSNGIHFNTDGYARVAPLFADGLGIRQDAWSVNVDLRNRSLSVRGARPGKTVWSDNSVEFKLTDDCLPLPVAANSSTSLRRVALNGAAGVFSLAVDGTKLATFNPESGGVAINASPQYEQAKKLHRAILQKNEYFFHRWRPANETYIFGFRNHEQGNNAVEMPQFDPLIAKLEAEIARLKVPVEHTYVIRRED